VEFACIWQESLKKLIADSRFWRVFLKPRDSRYVEGAMLSGGRSVRPVQRPSISGVTVGPIKSQRRFQTRRH
jgi:hypothetical protein